jgi:transglutaminase-like putative cysteine protease
MSDAGEIEWTISQRFRVTHLTRYLYEGDVWDSFNEARLHPVNDTTQRVLDFQMRIDPASRVRDFPDLHGNCVHYFDVLVPHRLLEIESAALVQTNADTRGPVPASNPPEALQNSDVQELCFEFLNASHLVSLQVEIWHESRDALPAGLVDVWQDAVAIGRHIHRTFTYTPRATTVNTHPVEVVLTRRGVCQDFAHVMLGICRTYGIPARYVSGYFFNPNRAPDEIEASHAWVEVYLPGYGWKGFDPTHNRVPDTRYIKLAVGRDYADIKPVSGTFRGNPSREMVVEVRVRWEQ